jgi:DNA-directed RNA polymerase subunit M/transcription elongation factor TFIIS
MDIRDKTRNIIKKNIGLDESNSIDLEKGIYNWSIEYADSNKVIKNWKNPIFKRIYIEKTRNVMSNLNKDSYVKNEKLYDRLVVDKEFLPHDIPFMRPENMYPSHWIETNERYLKKFAYAYENKKVATTDQFRCGKCKKRECTFYTMQTRSSDEPETIFIRCLNCGNQWRQ